MLLKTPLPSTSNVPLNDESPIIIAFVSTLRLPSTLSPAFNDTSLTTVRVLFKVVAPSTFKA